MIQFNLKEVQKYLKSLCQKYDTSYGQYPESTYEGKAIYEFFCEENNLPHNSDQEWADMFPSDWDL